MVLCFRIARIWEVERMAARRLPVGSLAKSDEAKWSNTESIKSGAARRKQTTSFKHSKAKTLSHSHRPEHHTMR